MTEAIEENTEIKTDFWVSTYPFFQTSLHVLTGKEEYPTKVELYDADGREINKLTVIFPPQSVGTIEIDEMMGACKLESGLKHAHLIVTTTKEQSCMCRLSGYNSSAILGECSKVTADNPGFLPIHINDLRTPLIALVNQTPVDTNVRCKLFTGNRAVEIIRTVPGMGVRLLSLQGDYSELIETLRAPAFGYLRLTVKGSDSTIGLQLLEQSKEEKSQNIFSSIT